MSKAVHNLPRYPSYHMMISWADDGVITNGQRKARIGTEGGVQAMCKGPTLCLQCQSTLCTLY